MLSTYTPYIISFLIGYLLIFCFQDKSRPLPPGLHIFLAIGLGLGVSAQITFWGFLIFKTFNQAFVVCGNLAALAGLLAWATFQVRGKVWRWVHLGEFHWIKIIPLVILSVCAYPLWKHGHFYVYGGWDAWATWNLKAKILFLSETGWSKIFEPVLWRSSPHYPLQLPLTNCWGWVFKSDAEFITPVTTAFVFSFATVGLLYSALAKITRSPYAIFSGLILLTSTMYIKLSLSQYADIMVAYYLLAAIVCLVFAKTDNSRGYAILSGIALGFLSFSKGEGLIAAGIIGLLAGIYFFWKNKPDWSVIRNFYLAAVLAGVVTVVFTFFVAPKSETFINGLTSPSHPVSWYRVKAIVSFMLVELVSPTWNGLWILLVLGILLTGGRCFRRNLIIIPAFLLGYIAIIGAYYFVNTYFDSTRILWWLQVSLHRLMYATLPTVVFWVFAAVWMSPSQVKLSAGSHKS